MTGPATSIVLPGRFRAAIFDMDGLLLDTEGAWQQAERDMLFGRGAVFTDEDAVATIGRSVDDSIAIYGARLGMSEAELPDLRAELLSRIAVAYRSVRPEPGALELVEGIRGRMLLAVASNTTLSLVELALSSVGLAEAFDAIVGAEDVRRPKPAPDLFELACDRLRVSPSDAVAFEDSTLGIDAARAAGLCVVAVPSSPVVDVTAADIVLASLSEVVLG